MFIPIKAIIYLCLIGATPAVLRQNTVKPVPSVDTLRIKSIRILRFN